MRELTDAMGYVQWESPFDEVATNERALMEARSRQMLKTINTSAAGLQRTIYKVGDEHVQDIQRLHLQPAVNVTVLSRVQYFRESHSLENRRAGVQYLTDNRSEAAKSAPNRRIADQISNDDLD
jgi:hypothetical protein